MSISSALDTRSPKMLCNKFLLICSNEFEIKVCTKGLFIQRTSIYDLNEFHMDTYHYTMEERKGRLES